MCLPRLLSGMLMAAGNTHSFEKEELNISKLIYIASRKKRLDFLELISFEREMEKISNINSSSVSEAFRILKPWAQKAIKYAST
jgi:hypothetical protein